MTDPRDGIFGIARLNANGGGSALGTAFGVRPKLLATCLHNVGGEDSNLHMLMPEIQSIDDYQDASNNSFRSIPLKIKLADPIRDVCILEILDPTTYVGHFASLTSPDNSKVGDTVSVFGYPHSVDAGRVVLTRHDTIIGAKVKIVNRGISLKHVVVNTQARPGQSGGPVYSYRQRAVVAMVMGSFAPSTQGMLLGGVDPQTLHQTTHALSAEYIARMLPDV